MRLFTAVLLPAPVVDHLRLALAELRAASDPRGPLRWTAEDAWHVTVGFHGEVPAGTLPDLAEAVTAAAAGEPGFDLALAGAGAFAGRTLWIGVGGEVEALRRLTAAVRDTAGAVGVAEDARVRSRAHLTVARVRPGAGSAPARRRRGSPGPGGGGQGVGGQGVGGQGVVDDLVRALAVYRGPSWRVGEVALLASELGAGPGGGPRHEVLTRAPLAG